MKDGFYKVVTNNYVFYMEVIVYDSYVTINYGDPLNKEGPCCTLTYDLDVPDKIKLDGISYYSRCSNGKELEKGNGTIEMLRSVLKLCIDEYPAIKRIFFNDVSAFECNNRHVYLSFLGILNHGQTWYQRHFGAKTSNKGLREKIASFNLLLSNKPSKGIFTFYDSKINAKNWYEYFTIVRKQQGCMFFIENETEIKARSRLDLLYSEWYISSKTVSTYNVTYEYRKIKKQKGGGISHRSKPMCVLCYEDAF